MITLIPVICWKKGIRIAIVSCGQCFLCNRFLQGCSTFCAASHAATRLLNSSSTSSMPQIRLSFAFASSAMPCSIIELGVSGRTSDSMVIIRPGTMAPPKLKRHP
ncbi:hypothetical protein Vadar_024517 [Vaccinium darrowii]|uniref:Uncharacterized protein n=1 Tax=Vaccinium darrowii TaxID=229202 RepID=A0ACB7ZL89_9ERIC|nr:hypothetical protein Vadar_024517 [Vaccinium darrowii]